jgi:adenylosuccinate synthase
MPGWKVDISDVTTFEDLPAEARAYVERIEELADAPVTWVSVGPKRSQTLVRRDVPLVPGAS